MGTTKSMTRTVAIGTGLILTIGLGSACSKKSDSSSDSSSGTTYSASAPSGVMGGVQGAVAAIGTEMTAASFAMKASGDVSAMFSSSQCSSHGDPDQTAFPSGQSDPKYPGILTYCKLAINDGSPDTVQGGFAIVKAISCALEGSLTWDGNPVATSFTPSSTCFTADQLTDIGTSPISATVTSSAPAAFNSYFTHGISIAVSGFGTFVIGAKVSGNEIEFISYENQSADKLGTTYGYFNTSTGVLRYEARMERLDNATSGSGGWNRHIRMYATMQMSGSTPTDLDTISFAYSNIQDSPGQSGPGGVLVTAKGDLSTGIKARLWGATNGSSGAPTTRAHVYTVGNWSEVTNTHCYTSSSESATTCDSGISGLSGNAYFLLPSTGYTSGYTNATSFYTGFSGATYTSVNVTSDPQ